MSVAKIRRKAVLVCLDDFRFRVNQVQYDLNQTIWTYWFNLADLFAARLGQYVKCSYYPFSFEGSVPKTFDGLVAEARRQRSDCDYDYVAFISKDYVYHPRLQVQFDWTDLDEKMCFVKFEKDQWEAAGISAGRNPFQSAILWGCVWMLSHELNHLVAWEYNQSNHDWSYPAVEKYRFYDERFNIKQQANWDEIDWHLIAVELPESWMGL